MWSMVEYSVTNNSFGLELNGNNLVKFVDQQAKWVGIRAKQRRFRMENASLMPKLPTMCLT